jgi:hypothetical protein
MENNKHLASLTERETRQGRGAYQIERLACNCKLLDDKHHRETLWLLRDTRSGNVVDVDEDRNALVTIRNSLNTEVFLREYL